MELHCAILSANKTLSSIVISMNAVLKIWNNKPNNALLKP